MEKWRKGYKAVSKHGNQYRSYTYGHADLKIYAIDHITRRTPSNGPLAVFDTKRNVRKMIEHSSEDTRVFRCRYTISADTEYWIESTLGRLECIYYPRGARFADAVELIKEVAV